MLHVTRSGNCVCVCMHTHAHTHTHTHTHRHTDTHTHSAHTHTLTHRWSSCYQLPWCTELPLRISQPNESYRCIFRGCVYIIVTLLFSINSILCTIYIPLLNTFLDVSQWVSSACIQGSYVAPVNRMFEHTSRILNIQIQICCLRSISTEINLLAVQTHIKILLKVECIWFLWAQISQFITVLTHVCHHRVNIDTSPSFLSPVPRKIEHLSMKPPRKRISSHQSYILLYQGTCKRYSIPQIGRCGHCVHMPDCMTSDPCNWSLCLGGQSPGGIR